MTIFEISVTLECPLEEAFDFLIRPENVARISPPEVGLHFVSAPDVLELGSVMEFKVQSYGQVQQIKHEITQMDRPRQFVEQQIQGPFKHWIHEHTFTADEAGIVVTDRIEFEKPGGLIGLLVTEQKILDTLDDAFSHRHDQIRSLLIEG